MGVNMAWTDKMNGGNRRPYRTVASKLQISLKIHNLYIELIVLQFLSGAGSPIRINGAQ